MNPEQFAQALAEKEILLNETRTIRNLFAPVARVE